jgi:hypothetical protein
MAAANFGSVSSAERSLKTHLDRTNGRTVAVVAHAPHDSFVLVASGSASCASGDGCVPTITERWSITVDVR